MTTATARRYEGLFLVDNNRASQAWDTTLAHITEILEKHGSSIVQALKWEERKLAYEIKGHRRGTYILIYFDGSPTSIDTIRRDFTLSETVMRCLITRLETPMLSSPGDLYADGAVSQDASEPPPPPPPGSVPSPISTPASSTTESQGAGKPASEPAPEPASEPASEPAPEPAPEPASEPAATAEPASDAVTTGEGEEETSTSPPEG
jgi:ribosomal protein S6